MESNIDPGDTPDGRRRRDRGETHAQSATYVPLHPHVKAGRLLPGANRAIFVKK